MADTRARSARTGGAALPMTRRQQKRVRQQAPQPAQRAARAPRLPVGAPDAPPPIDLASVVDAQTVPETEPARPAPRSRVSGVTTTRTLADVIAGQSSAPSRPASKALRAARPSRPRALASAPPAEAELVPETIAQQPTPEMTVEVEPVARVDDDVAPPIATEPVTQTTQTKKYPTLAKIAAVRRPARAEEAIAEADVAGEPGRDVTDASNATEQSEPLLEMDSSASEVETHPLRARRPTVTPRLQATRDDAAIATMREQAHEPDTEESLAARYHAHSRPHPLSEIDLTVPVAGAHAAIAAMAALAGATLLVRGASGAIWPLTLTAIAGLGGWLAYALGQQPAYRRVAGAALTLSQVGVLLWLMLVIGPRSSLVALAPAVALLALRMSGLLAAIAGSVLAVAAYLTVSLLSVSQRVTAPVRVSQTGGVLFDVAAASIGVGVALVALDLWHRQQARLDQQARGRLREARTLRTQSAHDRRQIEEDVRGLEDALAEALRGQGSQTPRVTPELEAVAECITVVAERLRTLQQDREDRLRMEGALRSLIREVERAWLGLPWAWPAPSGTTLDELVALLRAPRSHEAPPSWPEETPTLVPIPSAISQPSRPWDVVSPSDFAWNSRPRDPLYAQLTLGLDETDPSRAAPAHPSLLPWREWDMWADWDRGQSHVVGE